MLNNIMSEYISSNELITTVVKNENQWNKTASFA